MKTLEEINNSTEKREGHKATHLIWLRWYGIWLEGIKCTCGINHPLKVSDQDKDDIVEIYWDKELQMIENIPHKYNI